MFLSKALNRDHLTRTNRVNWRLFALVNWVEMIHKESVKNSQIKQGHIICNSFEFLSFQPPTEIFLRSNLEASFVCARLLICPKVKSARIRNEFIL